MDDKKIALISGGLGDIGQAVAVLCGRRGMQVAISDLADADEASPALERMRAQGCTELFYRRTDVSSEDEVADWLRAVTEKWGVPRVVIPNAGIVVSGGLISGGVAAGDVRRQMDVNFWGSYHVAVQAARCMREAKMTGRIVFMGSWVADRADPRIASYCISKASVRMLCRTLALELAEDGILVNEVAPGIVAGGLSRKNQEKNPELLTRHLSSIPVHQLIGVEEVATHVLNLCDFGSMNLTGTTLLVDGGLSLTSRMTL